MAGQKRHHDSQAQNSQTSTNATTYRCHQILPMVLGLNNSYRKIVHIGLENTSVGSGDLNPVVRLSNNEFYGLCLSLASWLQFLELFDEIDRYFQAYSEDDMLNQRITFSGFYIRFMISYFDRAFELLEDDETTIRKDSGESRSKKVRKPSLVFKRVTFDRLKALSKIIDHRIKYLLKVKEAITIIVKELGDYSKDKLVNSENAQFTYFTSYNVELRGYLACTASKKCNPTDFHWIPSTAPVILLVIHLSRRTCTVSLGNKKQYKKKKMAGQKRHHDSQAQNSQTSTNATKYRCHQILPVVFGLNNSYGKIIHIGMENISVGSDDFNPVDRLSNNEFYGLCLPLASWIQFRELFDEIDRYFQAYSEDDMLDQRITFSGFYIRFMISYFDRAFELLEDDETTIRKDSGVRRPQISLHFLFPMLSTRRGGGGQWWWWKHLHIIHQSFVDRRGVNTLTSKLLHRSPKCLEKPEAPWINREEGRDSRQSVTKSRKYLG
ncbi:hypothetical protein TSAR_006816 [Trichomalopsis sarcophagae]|uniref:Uncharacterized protein n=1 Tax=Trichomalopsis sarcophagae TaxID=543379 RepID=A0A232F3C8_9HYME|nr:hypothetical protein TSAR_006816 [Trichomalopsis sarcophagae]